MTTYLSVPFKSWFDNISRVDSCARAISGTLLDVTEAVVMLGKCHILSFHDSYSKVTWPYSATYCHFSFQGE